MGDKKSGIILFMHSVLLLCNLIGFVSILISLVSSSWWTQRINLTTVHFKELATNKIGLWKMCINFYVKGIQKCENYQNVLAFQDNRLVLGHLFPVTITQRDFDIVLLLIIIASIGYLISCLGFIGMIQRRDYEVNKWRKAAFFTITASVMTGFITLSACLYAEKRIQRTWYDENKRINYTYGHGWCLLVAWVCSVIPFILVGGIILVICFLKKA